MQHLMIRVVLVAVLGLVAALPVMAQDTGDVTARLLSKSVMAGFQTGLDSAEADGGVDPGLARCLRTLDPLSMEPSFRRLLASRFSDAELARLDAFYGSPLAELHLRSIISALRVTNGLPDNDPVTLTDTQRVEAEVFFASDLGKRVDAIGGEADAEGAQVIDAEIDQFVERCS